MNTPGFIIKNETIWPLQISLRQVGPLYYGVVPPGQTFVRKTGAVWFTIQADVFLDEEDRITDWDVVWPIGAVAVSVLIAAATAGAAAYAAGPAMAAIGGATGALSGATITGLGAPALAAVSLAAQGLVGAGFSAGAALVVGGVVVGGTATAATAATGAALKDVFSKHNTSVSKGGCYAGPDWPFRTTVKPYRVVGGPTYKPGSSKDRVDIVGQRLRIVQ